MLSPSNPRKSLADDMVNMDDSLHQLVTISSNPDLQKPLDTKSSGSAFWGGGGGKSVSGNTATLVRWMLVHVYYSHVHAFNLMLHFSTLS